MMGLGVRMLEWAVQRRPLHRNSLPESSNQPSSSFNHVLLDACDLTFNLRGIGWAWSRGLHVPASPKTSTSGFLLRTISHLTIYFITFDSIHYTVQSFSPSTFGSSAGGSIFDASIPPLRRYQRSSLITFLCAIVIYTSLVVAYDIILLISFLISSILALFALARPQDPGDWPALFQKPYLATSLADFWGRRWHQVFRRSFLVIGAEPLQRVIFSITKSKNHSRAAGVLGAFLVSGLLHDWGMWGMGRGADPYRVVGFFLSAGVGMILESMWETLVMNGGKLRGKERRKVGGVSGWIWTMAWTTVWGQMLVEAWLVRGLAGSVFMPEWVRPGRAIVETVRQHWMQ
jgi:hypothetical protein